MVPSQTIARLSYIPCGTQLFAEVVDHPVLLVESERGGVLFSCIGSIDSVDRQAQKKKAKTKQQKRERQSTTR